VPQGPRVPKSLPKREVDRLLRAAERDGNKRNLAVVLLLRHTGLRVGLGRFLHGRSIDRQRDIDVAARGT
jgi:hypothetical protein